MTDENVAAGTDAEGVDWGDMSPATPDAYGAAYPSGVANEEGRPSYPEYPDNPHNHRFTLSVTGDKAPMMVIRANTAAEMTAAINELEAYGVWANVGAAHASMRAQGALGAGLGPVTPVGPPQAAPAPPAPAPQYNASPPQQSPGAPPFGPNVSAPQAPGYQGPPQGFPPPPQQGGWGGGQQRSQEKPRPAGWLMVDVPFNDKDRFKQMREAGKDYFRGKVQWGGKGVYWLEPSIAQYVAQQGFPVTQ